MSGLRKMIVSNNLSDEGANLGLAKLQAIRIVQMPPSLQLQKATLHWARRLGLRVAYDAAYLALADDLRAEFWTADARLARNAQGLGASWVHWIGASA